MGVCDALEFANWILTPAESAALGGMCAKFKKQSAQLQNDFKSNSLDFVLPGTIGH